MAKSNQRRPAQWVVNETDKPIHAAWDGKTYIWDPHPKHAKKGQDPEMYALKPTVGEVSRGFFYRGDNKVTMNPGQGIKEGDKLVLVTPADKTSDKIQPEYKHLCDPDFVKAMRYTNKYQAGGVANLTFTDTIVDQWDAELARKTSQAAAVDSQIATRMEQLKKLDAELAIKMENAKQLDAMRK